MFKQLLVSRSPLIDDRRTVDDMRSPFSIYKARSKKSVTFYRLLWLFFRLFVLARVCNI